jgi:Zn-dependent protease with chaperone function
MSTTTWAGYYLDGKSAIRRPAQITLSSESIDITTDTGQVFRWPFEAIQQTQGSYAGEPVRLERVSTPEAIVVSSLDVLTELHKRASHKQWHVHDPSRRRNRIRWTVIAAVTAIGVACVLYRWGIPLVSVVVASSVPVTWEQRLGEQVVQYVAPQDRRCTDPYRTQLILKILTSLTDAAPKSPYKFHLYLVDLPVVNAIAVPGGHIVVYRGLLERTKSPEQLAGVLAHEIQHILRRHSTRMITQQILTGILLSTLAGDFSSAMTYGLQSAQAVGQLQYSQAHETEADEEGMRLIIKAGLIPHEMIAFYRIMGEAHDRETGVLDYLSSHPHMNQRIARLEAIASGSPTGIRRLLTDVDWKVVRGACSRRASVSRTPSTS